jgi:hypothetical protein
MNLYSDASIQVTGTFQVPVTIPRWEVFFYPRLC